MVKKFLFSAIALIGFTVASYGANTVEVEVNENLLVEEMVSPCDDCYHNFNHNFNLISNYDHPNLSFDEMLDAIVVVFDRCTARHCQN